MTLVVWYVVAGLLLIAMALADSFLRRLPLTTGLLYLVAGVLLGPFAIGLIRVDPLLDATLLERIAEIVVIVALFAAGLKLRTPLNHRRWVVPVALAFASMTLTVALIALVAHFGLGLSPGAAILLGAIIAPTDPVLASDVQVEGPGDIDRVRFGLTGEAGLNDGTAFPFVMLGLGLLGLHEIGDGGWRWLAIDVVWAIPAGLTVGTLLGMAVGRVVLYLRKERREAIGVDDFLALGLIALSYGLADAINAYGFLAVFAAGLALRRVERASSEDAEAPPEVTATAASEDAHATDPELAPAYMAQAVLGFSEQLERIGTVGVVLLVGAMLTTDHLFPALVWFVPLTLVVIRPLATVPVLSTTRLEPMQRWLIGWFGVRGIGSIYYLMFAISHDLPDDVARTLIAVTLTMVATSIAVHGVTVTPLMNAYGRRFKTRSTQIENR